MMKRYEQLESAFRELWTLMTAAEPLVRGDRGRILVTDDPVKNEIPDFSAVIRALSPQNDPNTGPTDTGEAIDSSAAGVSQVPAAAPIQGFRSGKPSEVVSKPIGAVTAGGGAVIRPAEDGSAEIETVIAVAPAVQQIPSDGPELPSLRKQLAGSESTAAAAVQSAAPEHSNSPGGYAFPEKHALQTAGSSRVMLPAYAASCRNLQELAQEVMHCTRCRLSETRSRAVPGSGVFKPKVMIVGEGPGAEEDASGEPFVGAAGKYLDTWMAAIKLYRGRDLYIANIVKCRPPGNRNPLPDEQQVCLPFLIRQIELIKPQILLALGLVAAQQLTGSTESLRQLRTRQHHYEGIPLVVTYHPSAVLRYPHDYRAPVWEDLRKLAELFSTAGERTMNS